MSSVCIHGLFWDVCAPSKDNTVTEKTWTVGLGEGQAFQGGLGSTLGPARTQGL